MPTILREDGRQHHSKWLYLLSWWKFRLHHMKACKILITLSKRYVFPKTHEEALMYFQGKKLSSSESSWKLRNQSPLLLTTNDYLGSANDQRIAPGLLRALLRRQWTILSGVVLRNNKFKWSKSRISQKDHDSISSNHATTMSSRYQPNNYEHWLHSSRRVAFLK